MTTRNEDFDSIAEARAAEHFRRLGCVAYKQKLPITFTDADGVEFEARADWFHPVALVYLEFKAAPLNGVRTKESSDRQLSARDRYRRMKRQSLSMFDKLSLQWNHSKSKHAIIQRKKGVENYCVVFEHAPSADEAIRYYRAGLVFTPLASLASFLGCIQLTKAGVPAGFTMTYADGEASQTDLSWSTRRYTIGVHSV